MRDNINQWPAEAKYRGLTAIVSETDSSTHYVSFAAFDPNKMILECGPSSCRPVENKRLNDAYPKNHTSFICSSEKGDGRYVCKHTKSKALTLNMLVMSEVVPGLQVTVRPLLRGMVHEDVQELVLQTLDRIGGEHYEAGGGGDCLFHTFS